ncbi:hypothetical protein [Reichenbachiella agariperforans]|uniref:hypothetical protein n=1 Tax=Reichenbachiella agariperforans TaxID=156994 RepID=UPI001C0821A7|nr:hypothetical protein [Reichenbachiella agariperforans]MBU2915127.1 hypothetical protein [Reichenbachiella agariperforans]
MNLPALESEIAKKIHTLNVDQKVDIMQYINRIAGTTTKESYRNKAIREIRRALSAI